MAVEDEGAVAANDSPASKGINHYQPLLDPLDPRKVALDMFELYSKEMITTASVARRAFLINNMKYLIDKLIGAQYGYGRLYNRTCIANMVSRICARYAYEMPDEIEESYESCQKQLEGCLIDYTPHRWDLLVYQFESLRESMLRNDATLTVLPSLGKNEELEGLPEDDESMNEALESHADFTKGYKKILNLMKFHACLSHLQPYLENAIRGEESVVIPNENIIAFELAIEENFGEKGCKHATILKALLEANESDEGPHLKSFSQIKKICAANTHDFDLMDFQRKFLDLIRRWDDLVLPVPELSMLNYGAVTAGNGLAREPMTVLHEKENMNLQGSDGSNKTTSLEATSKGRQQEHRRDDRKPPPEFEYHGVEDDIESSDDDDEKKMDAVGVLKRKRKALNDKVKDPRDKCVAAASLARRRIELESDNDSSSNEDKKEKSPSICKGKKKNTYRLSFNSSGSDDSEGEGNDVKLSQVPTQYKPAKVQSPKQIHVSRKNAPGKKRKRFTEIEDDAIKKGVEIYGEGQWACIKSHFTMELRNGLQSKSKIVGGLSIKADLEAA
eukprot:CAMPEP_0183736140 /NCGR_PEP_ID=MMETSP0737-20130205/48588_1 /TAXON_ID=385413 /ORGANISM="Thalassiosira miniscula, Strain CCMP1093" /LENGTH=559 /DNA_ID=CAMNT_0025970073 /DNA_START=81 /DNA_END=1761 /DNA_ORIENTATION=+